jgi:hypothetical protein
VVREYVGKGRIGQLAAQLDAANREVRATELREGRVRQAELEAIDVPLRNLDELTDALVRAVLLANGYHQHKRGEWRKRREQ